MGAYVNPPESVRETGRPLQGREYIDLKSQLRPGEVLVGLGDRLVRKIAPVIRDQSDFDEFREQYKQGMLVSLDWFAVPQTTS